MDRFSLVFICSGNRFRSPLAEAFVRRLTVGYPVTASSLGTLRLGPVPSLPEAIDLGRWCNVDLSEHRADVLSDTSLEGVDLVVGFEEEHVRRAVIDAGAQRRHAFTFPQIVGLLEDDGPASASELVHHARAAVDEAASLRDADPQGRAGGEISDPFGRPWRVYRATAEEVRVLSLELVRQLFGIEGGSVLPMIPSHLARRTARRLR